MNLMTNDIVYENTISCMKTYYTKEDIGQTGVLLHTLNDLQEFKSGSS